MNHEHAVQTQAAERYVLGDMDQQEHAAFEEHFFSCESCAGDVRATADFANAARAIFRERHRIKPIRRRVGWNIPAFSWAAAAAVCLVIAGYQNFTVIPDLKTPRSITSGVIFDGPTRSAPAVLHAGEALHFQMPWDGGGPAYVELRNGSTTVSSGKVQAPPPNQPLEVYFPSKLKPGHYSVAVRALRNGEIAEKSIENQFEVIP